MSELLLPRATVVALRARHIAFLSERLASESARGDWVRGFDAAYDHFLTLRVREVVHPEILVQRLVQVASQDAISHFVAPLAREIHRRVVAALAKDTSRVGDYVPEEAREAIDAILSRRSVLPDELVRQIFDQEEIDDVLRDVLFDALKEFNDSVNPFFAEWGLPALLKRLMPIGSGTVLKSIGLLRGEFDKRLEPEIRKFLLAFSRKAKRKIADFVLAQGAQTSSDAKADAGPAALRRAILSYLYARTLSESVANVDDETRKQTDSAATAIVLEILGRTGPREQLRASLEALVAEHGDETIGEWLAAMGVSGRPELEAIAELTWPAVREALQTPPFRAFVERLIWDFYATIPIDDR